MRVIFYVAYAIAAALVLIPPYLVHRNRPRSAAELREDEWRKQIEADRAFLRANAKTPEEKTLVGFWFDHDFEKEKGRFRLSDGVSQYEAWMLATTYFGANFGVCGSVGLPKKEGAHWKVHIGIGRLGEPGTILIDTVSGIVSCEGHPTVSDPLAFLQHPKTPNKSPEPTPTAVTPRATEGKAK